MTRNPITRWELRHKRGRTDQGSDVATIAEHAENQNVLTLDTIENQMTAHREAAQAGAQILATVATSVGIPGNQEETVGDGVDQAISDLRVAAFDGDVAPDFVEVGIGFGCATVRHLARRVLFGGKSGAPTLFDAFGQVEHRRLSDDEPFASGQRCLCLIHREQYLKTFAFARFPQGQCFPHCVLFALKTSALNGLTDKRRLIWGEPHFHGGCTVRCQNESVNPVPTCLVLRSQIVISSS